MKFRNSTRFTWYNHILYMDKATLIFNGNLSEVHTGERGVKETVGELWRDIRTIGNKKIPDKDKAKIFSKAGNTRADSFRIVKNVATSGALTTVISTTTSVVEILFAGYGLTHSFFQNMPHWVPFAAAGVSYAAFYGSLFVNGKQNIKLIQSNVRYCANLPSYAVYHLTDKMFRKQKEYKGNNPFKKAVNRFLKTPEKKRDAATIITPMTGFWVLEPGFLAGVVVAPSITVARNIGLTGFNLVNACANEIWLRTKGGKKKEAAPDYTGN